MIDTAQLSENPIPEVMSDTENLQSAPLQDVDLTQKGSLVMNTTKLPLILAAVAVVAGIATGWGAAQLQSQTTSTGGGEPLQKVATGTVRAGEVFGSPDKETFKDMAEGYLEVAGADEEGSHRLLRVGGPSQTVHLTSSVTDLEKFIGMNVKIWGETNKAQKAGWLMDVGRVEVVNPTGQPPAEE